MATGSFPTDPTTRKVIVVMHAHDIEKCNYELDAAQALLDEEAYVLPFPLRSDGAAPTALSNIINAGLARPGLMLVQSPYDPESYEDATLAPQRFALAKHLYFSTLCMYLGAREVVVEQIDLTTRTGKSTMDLKGERLGVSARVDSSRDDLEKFRAHMLLRDEFEGAPANLGAADELLRRTGLLADPNLRTLIEMRRDSANPIKMRKLALNLSSETKSNLSIVGRLKVPAFVNLSAAYDRVVKEQQDFTLTVVVKF